MRGAGTQHHCITISVSLLLTDIPGMSLLSCRRVQPHLHDANCVICMLGCRLLAGGGINTQTCVMSWLLPNTEGMHWRIFTRLRRLSSQPAGSHLTGYEYSSTWGGCFPIWTQIGQPCTRISCISAGEYSLVCYARRVADPRSQQCSTRQW